MLNKIIYNDYWLRLLFFAVVIGIISSSAKKVAFFLALMLIIIALWDILKNKNKNGEAHLYSGFILGSEVYFRMSFSGLPWEFGKIAISLFLVIGLLIENKGKPIPYFIFLYPILLLPSLFIFNDLELLKKEFMFNLSGHINLFIAFIYFYKREFSSTDFENLFRMIVLGVVIMSIVIFIVSPSYSSIQYGGGSNFEASGGFGPNQVGTIYALGILIILVALFLNFRLFKYKSIDILILLGFSMQTLFTLSRGGIFGTIIALSLGVIFFYLSNNRINLKKIISNLFKLILIGVLGFLVFKTADEMSNNAISKRYFNVDETGMVIKEDYSTHRSGIFDADIETFQKNFPTGAGLAGSRSNREFHTGISAVHVEFSRLLADHGVLGILILLFLFIYPIVYFLKNISNINRFYLIVFPSFALLTMSHNAMRLAIPSFCFALGFILYNELEGKEKYK